MVTIKRFQDIEMSKEEYFQESPLNNYTLIKNLFKIGINDEETKESLFIPFLNLDIGQWEIRLQNKINEINLDFATAMFYFYRGIPDDEWKSSPGKNGLSVEYFPHFEEHHYSNQYSYNYFVQVFFYKAATLYEVIGHLLYKHFELPLNEKRFIDKVSYKSAVKKLKAKDEELYETLSKLLSSSGYLEGERIRNDITHNQPAYEIKSIVTFQDGITTIGTGEYTPSKEIKRVMIDYLKSIHQILVILETRLL